MRESIEPGAARHRPWRAWRWPASLALLLLMTRPALAQAWAIPQESAACFAAIAAAEARHGIPAGLLRAISLVETGRADRSGLRRPWPWTTNVEGEGDFHPSREDAVQRVRLAWARGTTSVDVGCLQVNLRHHPAAFGSLEEAFDPVRNAEYAARFLASLAGPLGTGGDWMAAAGHYHSRTPALADRYRQRVTLALNEGGSAMPATSAISRAAPRRAPAAVAQAAQLTWASRTAETALRAAGVSGVLRRELRALLLARDNVPP